MDDSNRARVLLAKPGLDGHDLGIKAVARALRDDGMEVVYLGINVTPQIVVSAAIQESVDVLGISCLSGSHMMLCEKICTLLAENDLDDLKFVVGGIIPDSDVESLKKLGVDAVFGTGTPMREIVDIVNRLAA